MLRHRLSSKRGSRLKLLSTWTYFAHASCCLGPAVDGGRGRRLQRHVSVSFGGQPDGGLAALADADGQFPRLASGVVVMAAMMGRTVQQDFEYEHAALLLQRADQASTSTCLGRFFGAYLTLAIDLHSASRWAPGWAPTCRASIAEPHRPIVSGAGLSDPLCLLVMLPNIFIFGAIFFVHGRADAAHAAGLRQPASSC